jgi:hypothetical protein
LEVSTLQECKKTKKIRSGSVLQDSAISTFPSPDLLLLVLSSKSLTNIEVAAYTSISEKSIGESRAFLIGLISSWLLANATPLGGSGVIVETDGNTINGNTIKETTERACGF